MVEKSLKPGQKLISTTLQKKKLKECFLKRLPKIREDKQVKKELIWKNFRFLS